jgi:outer membrane immunogenic protein
MYKVSKLAAGSVIATTAALGWASVALADGYEPRRVAYERPTDWSGVYFGVGSGYQWSSIDVNQVPSAVNPGAGSANPGIGINSEHNEAFVSAHLGAQHQFGNIVLGIEGGWMSTLRDRDGSHEFCDTIPAVLSTPILQGGDFCTARLQDIITIGARAGWAMGRWMPYVTGGYANAGVDFAQRNPITATTGPLPLPLTPAGAAGATVEQEQAHTRLGGWYLGGGLEWAISPGWTTGIEYRHYEFGDGRTTGFSACGAGNPGCFSAAVGTPLERLKLGDTTDSVEARVSWRWGRPEAAPLK